MITPWPHQREAIDSLHNGAVLVAGTGAGKSLVALVYFLEHIVEGSIGSSTINAPKDIYVITTPKKRDGLDWLSEAARFGIGLDPETSIGGICLTVDSWNNVKKYREIKGAFFVFDEQRAVGSGTWSKAFVGIAKRNQWIMLSATPADTWIDLVPVFVANGFYKNRTAFIREHVVYSPYTKYPKILRYSNVQKLRAMRAAVFVVMPFTRKTTQHLIDVRVDYDKDAIKTLTTTEWNPVLDRPIRSAPEYRALARRIINADPSRAKAALDVHAAAKKLIVFYNFNHELEAMRSIFDGVTTVAEYNGHRHDPLPIGDNWVYLVQYMSGNEAWECFTTNHMLFYSLNYSYRITTQAMGRIDRLTTTYANLYYYRLVSTSTLDMAIQKAYSNKKDFNDRGLVYI